MINHLNLSQLQVFANLQRKQTQQTFLRLSYLYSLGNELRQQSEKGLGGSGLENSLASAKQAAVTKTGEMLLEQANSGLNNWIFSLPDSRLRCSTIYLNEECLSFSNYPV